MKRRLGKISITIACSTLLFMGIFLVTCGPTSPSNSGPTVSMTSLNDLKISNQISGWEVDSNYSDTAIPFTDSTSGPSFVDGGNIDYCGACNGHDALKSGFGIYCKNPQDNHKVEVFVLDYGTAAAARAEFNVWVNKNNGLSLPQETISPFSNTTSIGFEVGGGLKVYACFINYYVELQFANYNPSSLANSDAAAFLSYYNAKIK